MSYNSGAVKGKALARHRLPSGGGATRRPKDRPRNVVRLRGKGASSSASGTMVNRAVHTGERYTKMRKRSRTARVRIVSLMKLTCDRMKMLESFPRWQVECSASIMLFFQQSHSCSEVELIQMVRRRSASASSEPEGGTRAMQLPRTSCRTDRRNKRKTMQQNGSVYIEDLPT